MGRKSGRGPGHQTPIIYWGFIIHLSRVLLVIVRFASVCVICPMLLAALLHNNYHAGSTRFTMRAINITNDYIFSEILSEPKFYIIYPCTDCRKQLPRVQGHSGPVAHATRPIFLFVFVPGRPICGWII